MTSTMPAVVEKSKCILDKLGFMLNCSDEGNPPYYFRISQSSSGGIY